MLLTEQLKFQKQSGMVLPAPLSDFLLHVRLQQEPHPCLTSMMVGRVEGMSFDFDKAVIQFWLCPDLPCTVLPSLATCSMLQGYARLLHLPVASQGSLVHSAYLWLCGCSVHLTPCVCSPTRLRAPWKQTPCPSLRSHCPDLQVQKKRLRAITWRDLSH